MNRIQLAIAAGLSLGGVVLLTLAFYAPPVGEIHSSVLVAYGETLTFVGAIMGIDYKYKFNQKSKKP